MKDVFKEQLVAKAYTESDRTKKHYTIGYVIAFSLFIWEICSTAARQHENLSGAFFALTLMLIGIAIFLAYRRIKNLNVEYEYCYTDGILDIDIIKNKAKRKQIFSGMVEEFDTVCPHDDKQHLAMYLSLPEVDCTSGKNKDNTYVFVASFKGKKKRYKFEPCEEIVKAMRQDLASRMIMRKALPSEAEKEV